MSDVAALPAIEIEQRVALFLDEQFPALDELKKRAVAISVAALLQSNDTTATAPEDTARRYREASAFLDRALAGVSDDTKRNVLRVMMNLGVRPDDEMNVLFAVYGYFASMAEKVPQQMQAVVGELEQKESRFLDDIILLRETGEKLIGKISGDLETQAIEIGRTAVQSAVSSEYEAMRYQIGAIARDAFAAFADKMKTAPIQQAHATLPRKTLAVTVALMFCCIFAGWVAGSHTHAVSTSQATVLREGATYERMWQDGTMPPTVRAWLENWARTH